ncbi:MAG: sugar diacid recognition domain-containing protein [Peptostreptococcaceae bacterium]
MINKNISSKIVEAINEVIDKDINFINKKGMIIASTDNKRIDMFHEAGFISIQKKEPLIVEEDGLFNGSKKGINFPININDECIGSIGISGEPTEVEKYGFLAIKISEVFLKEQMLNYKYEYDKKRIGYIVKSLIYNDKNNEKELNEIINQILIRNNKFCCIVIKIKERKNIKLIQNIENDLNSIFDKLEIKLKTYIFPDEFIIICDEKKYKMLKENLLNIKYDDLYIGVSDCKKIEQTHKSYEEAILAVKNSIKNKIILTEINSLKFDNLINSINQDEKNEFKKSNLSNISIEEMEILKVYYENDMSLKITSEKLNIHKNTLQYRLDIIYEKSKLNPRKFKDAIVLYTAIKI